MARGWARQPELQSFGHGTKADRMEVFSRGKRSAARWEGPRRRSKSRNILDGFAQKTLISFPPLNMVGVDSGLSGWKSLFKEPKMVSKERVLNYYRPLNHEQDELPFVLVSEEAINREVKVWEKCLVAYVVGKRPFFQALKDRLEAQWNTNAAFRMHSMPGGFFLFSFLDEEDRNRVLSEGPWNFYGRPIVIKEWVKGMVMEKEQFNALPIWIRLPRLDLRFWDLETLGKIASVVGHPRFIDEATSNRDRLDFARICVEITPRCEFPTKVKILAGTKWTDQDIFYEWCPTCCARCNSCEHAEEKCSLVSVTEEEKSTQDNPRQPENADTGWQKVRSRKIAGNGKFRADPGAQEAPKQNEDVELQQDENTGREKSQPRFEMGGTSNVFDVLQQEVDAGAVQGRVGELIKEISDGPDADQARDKTGVGGSILMDDWDSDCGEEGVDASEGNETRVSETTDSACSSHNEKELDSVASYRAGKQGISESPVSHREESQQQEVELVIQLCTNDVQVNGGVEGLPVPAREGSSEGNANFLSHKGVRRSPRIRKAASNLADMINPKSFEPLSSSKGRKKGESLGHQ